MTTSLNLQAGALLRGVADGGIASSRASHRNASSIFFRNGKFFSVMEGGEIVCSANYPADNFNRANGNPGANWVSVAAQIFGNELLFTGTGSILWSTYVLCNKVLNISYDINFQTVPVRTIDLVVTRGCRSVIISLSRFFDFMAMPPVDYFDVSISIPGVGFSIASTTNISDFGSMSVSISEVLATATYNPNVGAPLSTNLGYAAAIWDGYPWWDTFTWACDNGGPTLDNILA